MTDTPNSIYPSAEAILKYFSYDHLPASLQAVSKPLSDLAYKMVSETAPGPEQTTGLRKLLESKDCFVRAAIVDFDPKAAIERLDALEAEVDALPSSDAEVELTVELTEESIAEAKAKNE